LDSEAGIKYNVKEGAVNASATTLTNLV